jgi:hypothetical protein
MNKCVRRREQNQRCGQRGSALNKTMVSPLVSKVNPSHLADVTALCGGSAVVEAAPVARLKAGIASREDKEVCRPDA